MNEDIIILKLQDVFREFFGNSGIDITKETKKEDIDEWDSVLHIQLIFEIESAFDVMFEAEDIPEMISIERITDKLQELGV